MDPNDDRVVSIAEKLKLAERHHRAGRLREAANMAREILQSDPEQIDAVHLLAMAAHQLGKVDYAAQCARHAVQAKPQNATYLRTLGAILRSQGRLDESIASYQKSIRLRPHDPTTHYNLGNALLEQGDLAGAIRSYQASLKRDPRNANTYFNLGKALESLGKAQEASTCYRTAIKLKPDYVQARLELANIMEAQGKLKAAVPLYVQALRYEPNSFHGHNNLGSVLNRQGRYHAAVTSFQQALRIDPNNAIAWNNLGNALANLEQFDEAEKSYQKAIALHENYARAYYNLGCLQLGHGELAKAQANFERAVGIEPDYAQAHVQLACIRLASGDFERGWPEYEWRLKTGTQPRFPQPRWDGGRLEGRTILLYTEHGFGDTFQFVRYAPLVKELGGTVLLACPQRMIDLLSSCPGIDQLVPREDPLPRFDLHASILSLPAILKTTAESIPRKVPYLSADSQLKAIWRDRLTPHEGRTIGIVWQSGPTSARDRHRSVPLEKFAPLVEVPRVRLVSLQQGPGTEQLGAIGDRLPVTTLRPQLDPSSGAFADTAAVIENLDLVITCDAPIAHLAGALGAPVWVALSYMPDWRWQFGRSDSPWYPSMRLFRQPAPGDWDSVFGAMKSALDQFVARPV